MIAVTPTDTPTEVTTGVPAKPTNATTAPTAKPTNATTAPTAKPTVAPTMSPTTAYVNCPAVTAAYSALSELTKNESKAVASAARILNVD